MRLPPPTSFAEGQRAVALWLMIGAGIFYGLGTAGVILLLWRGGWAPGTQSARIMWISIIGLAYALGSIAVTLALAVGGPVGRFKLAAGRDGASAEVEDHDDPPATKVTTTTEVQP
ncbi:MAG: hypothetical protein ACTHOJ_15645 [Sphingomonas oligoaromativorans]